MRSSPRPSWADSPVCLGLALDAPITLAAGEDKINRPHPLPTTTGLGGFQGNTVGPPLQPALPCPSPASWAPGWSVAAGKGKGCLARKALGPPELPLGKLGKDLADQPEPIPLVPEVPGEERGRALLDRSLWGQSKPGKRAHLAGLQCQERKMAEDPKDAVSPSGRARPAPPAPLGRSPLPELAQGGP